MPRRWYYSVSVTDQRGNIKTVYTEEAAEKIVEFIEDSGLEPEEKKSQSED